MTHPLSFIDTVNSHSLSVSSLLLAFTSHSSSRHETSEYFNWKGRNCQTVRLWVRNTRLISYKNGVYDLVSSRFARAMSMNTIVLTSIKVIVIYIVVI